MTGPRPDASFEERTTRLEQMHQQLRLSERLASIGTIAAGLCHDMNNLLMPIRGHLDAVESGGLTGDQLGHFASIRGAIDFLQQLTNGLRLFALDPDDDSASSGPTELAPWWRQLKPLLVRAIPDQIDFRADIHEGTPPVAVAPHRLTQAILNLLINAGDAVGARGEVHLWSEVTDDSRFVKLAVTDNGRGMSRETQKHALDPFFTTKTRGQSTGLGLSLVHGIVNAAGGRVDIESAPRRGTTITLYLPVSADQVAPEPPAAGGAALAVVDVDDPRIAACFESFLRSAGFDVRHGTGGLHDAASVWVTDASSGNLARARPAIEANAGLRMIAYGRGGPEWDRLGAAVVNRQAGLEGIRNAIEQLILAAEEQP